MTSTLSATPPQGSNDRKRTAIGAAVGTTVENYDLLIYGTAAALYFGEVFFPNEDPAVGVLIAFLSFGVGFVARPIGGILGGHFGDKLGRKPVLVSSLMLMGLSTVLIGCLPTYAQIGVAAPIALTVLRFIQGLAFGAEWGGAILMTYEHAPWRKRGQYSAIPQIGGPLGLFLANVAILVSVHLPGDWAWRVPFLLSSVLIITGFIIRSRLSESPEFEDIRNTGQIKKNPIFHVLKNDWRTVLRVIALRMAETAGFYIVVTYLISYVTKNGLATREVALLGLIIATALESITIVLFGALTDRVGRRTVYLIGSIFVMALGFPIFLLVNTGIAVAIVIAYILGLTVNHAMLAGTQSSYFSELFDPSTRTSGASLGYQLSAAISGFVPFTAAALSLAVGWAGVALLYVAAGLIGLVGALLTRETWSRQRRAEVEAASRAYTADRLSSQSPSLQTEADSAA